MEERYEFDEESWSALRMTAVDWRDVIAVLRGHPRHRQHVGSGGLVITGRATDGRWLMVGVTERPDRDDVYVVREVMGLTAEQQRIIEKRMEGEAR